MTQRHLPTATVTTLAFAALCSPLQHTWAQSGANSLEEIIVTAQRRSESLQDTALAISAVGGEKMRSQGVTNLADAIQTTPSVELWSSNLGGGFTIRGVGTRIPGVDSPTSTYSDGVFQSRAEVTNFAFVDVNRIEVLRGPQGTLYGRNAMAGAVNVITNNPSMEDFEASLNVQAGNYSSHHVEAVVNAPLGETAAARLVAVKDYHDGYLSNDLDDADSQAVRLKVLVEPSETVSLLARR